MHCPACGTQLGAEAPFCTGCGNPVSARPGFPPGSAEGPAPADEGRDWPTLYQVASSFRALLIWYGCNLLAVLASRALGGFTERSLQLDKLLVLWLLLMQLGLVAVALAFTVLMLIQVYRLTRAMGSKVPVLWLLAMLVPCLNLITLLALNSKACAFLQKAGVQVGLLGPSAATIQDLRRRLPAGG